MTPSKELQISQAKGRPMLSWVGKKPPRHVIAYPAQLVEVLDPSASFAKTTVDPCWQDWPSAYPKAGLLFHGDNKEVLAHLLVNGFRGKVKLVYIDPPFDSGADYVRKVQLRGVSGTAQIDGEKYALGEQIQYTDIWSNDNYLQFMYERLILLKELLSEDGFIFLQCDYRKSHHLRCVMDEVFGPGAFKNEIICRRGTTSVQAQFDEIESLVVGNYTILLYGKSADVKLPLLRVQRVIQEPGHWDTLWRNHDRPTMRYELLGVTPTEGQWRWSEPRGRRAVANYKRYLNESAHLDLDNFYLEHLEATGESLDFIKMGNDGNVQCYIPPRAERLASNIWMDLPHNGAVTDYPTEKSESVLERVISWASRPKDIVLDCFLGSGTTVAVAQKLGRRWIGCDINKGAIQTTSKRVQQIIREQSQIKYQVTFDETTTSPPVSLGLALYRVNNYDLQVQHNEAVNLACEHIGIERSRSDSFFDGTLGNRLVKVIPFNHPLTPIDLEETKRELESRPGEDRGIVLVCLGKELAADAWIGEWNRLRTGKNAVNRIEIIELRTDPKYGRFIAHEPATADVSIARDGDVITVAINEFTSPTIVKRLSLDHTIFKARITDWKSMVDCVMIDTNYNDEVFQVTLSDVPLHKDDLVLGAYRVQAPKGPTTVAVKIIDMLGEEVVVARTV